MVENISNYIEKKEYVLDKIKFLPNDYFDFVGDAQLDMKDTMALKKVLSDRFIVTVGRLIDSKEKNIFSLYVSFDIHLKLKKGINIDTLSIDTIEKYVDANIVEISSVCMAKISLLISQISSQIAAGVPIISPAQFIK